MHVDICVPLVEVGGHIMEIGSLLPPVGLGLGGEYLYCRVTSPHPAAFHPYIPPPPPTHTDTRALVYCSEIPLSQGQPVKETCHQA